MDYKGWLSKMSVREQALLLTGKDFWHTNDIKHLGIPQIMVSDGPNGLRKVDEKSKNPMASIKTVCFPTSSAVACSWNRDVMTILGETMAQECKANRVSVLLGPGINIKRTPLCGRNFEYYSEDPVLAGELAASFINGVQSKGIGTSLKHFAANNTESKRMVSNSLIDERALREIYLRGFEIAVKKAQPWTIMAAYNKLNGIYCTEHYELLTEILRNDWGYKGLVVSDWMAVNDRVAALKSGLDLEMPSSGYYNVYKIAKAYRDTVISHNELEASAGRVLDLVEKSTPVLSEFKPLSDLDADHEISKKVARDCIVLLKNENNVLPLDLNKRTAILGERAKIPMFQGFGSSMINSYKVENAFDSFVDLGANVEYSKGYKVSQPDEVQENMIKRAVDTAKECDQTVIFVSCNELDVSEGFERESMEIPISQRALIDAVCAEVSNVIVVLSSGCVMEMPWINGVKGLVQTYLSGEASGAAVTDILLGRVSPSGKLPETYPVSLKDTPCYDYMLTDEYDNVEYRESIYVGYRYYEKRNIPVLFPFGHGLSYTTFEYSNINVSSNQITDNDTLKVTLNVKNTGNFDAAEVIQLYVSCPDSMVFRAKKELKDFAKIYIKKGETKTIEFTLDKSAFEYFSPKAHAFVVENADYDIIVGSSSQDVRLMTKVHVSSNNKFKERDYFSRTPSYFDGNIKNASNEEFEYILNYYLSDFKQEKNIERLTVQNTLADAKDTSVGKKINAVIETVTERLAKKDPVTAKLIINSVFDSPIRKFTATSRGIISDDMLRGFVYLLNSSDIKGTAVLIAKGTLGSIKNILPPVMK